MNKIFATGFLVCSTFIISCNMNDSKQLTYKGDDLTGKVSLVRDKKSKQPQLNVQINGEWELYRANPNKEINRKNPLLTGSRPGEYPLSYTETRYHIYLFKSSTSETVLAERQLPIEGSYNFRELGGIQTKEGRYTKWGTIFRSDDLAHLTEGDVRYLNSIPLHTIVDFRSESEIEASPDKTLSKNTRNIPLSIAPGNLTESSGFDFGALTEENADSIMRAVNIHLVNDPASIEQYKTFFALLQNKDALPLVFHCTAGKDRTGYAAYLFLSSLGVDEEDIMQDYLASNHYLAGKYDTYIRQYPFIRPLMKVREAYLRTAINQINSQYGSVEDYLVKILNVDLNKMKEIYLY